MSSRGSKRENGQSSTPPSFIPQQRPKLSIPQVTTTSAPSIPKRKYKWLPEYEDDVKRIWNVKCSDILRRTMHNIRQDLFHKQLRPKWIPYEVMSELERMWTTPEYLKKCEIAKTNRASSKRGIQHKGGSVPNIEHKRRMAKDLGKESSVFELFKKTHYNEKSGEFADHRVAATHDEFLKLKASSEGSSVQSNQDELNLWLEVSSGKNKKGRIYRLGYENQHIVSSTSPPSINSTGDSNIQELHTTMTHLIQETERLKQENQHLKQTIDMIILVLQGMGIQLPSLSNLASDKAPSATNANKKAENEN